MQIAPEVDISRHNFQNLGLVTPKSRLGLDLGPLSLQSRSRHCSDVSKAHRCYKYVINSGKNCLFLRFSSHSGVMALF